jgi:ketosteroid isomerase-like protein
MKGLEVPVRWFQSCAALILPAALVVCLGCGEQQEEGVPADLRAAIDAFYAAVEAGDAEARIAMFSEEAVMMPNHWTMWESKEAIAEVIRAGKGSAFRLRDREIVDMDASDALAYTVNSYSYTYHAEGAEPRWHKTKNVHIWKRDAGGHWKLHVDIWNSDVPMSDFPNE